jgi:hypothetical protein
MGQTVTAPPPVLSPSSILPLRSSHCAFIRERKIVDAPLKYVDNFFFTFLKLRVWNCVTWNWVSRRVYFDTPRCSEKIINEHQSSSLSYISQTELTVKLPLCQRNWLCDPRLRFEVQHKQRPLYYQPRTGDTRLPLRRRKPAFAAGAKRQSITLTTFICNQTVTQSTSRLCHSFQNRSVSRLGLLCALVRNAWNMYLALVKVTK